MELILQTELLVVWFLSVFYVAPIGSNKVGDTALAMTYMDG
jgi:hypothetical protein